MYFNRMRNYHKNCKVTMYGGKSFSKCKGKLWVACQLKYIQCVNYKRHLNRKEITWRNNRTVQEITACNRKMWYIQQNNSCLCHCLQEHSIWYKFYAALCWISVNLIFCLEPPFFISCYCGYRSWKTVQCGHHET
jgi:hypothetical protein